MKTEKQKGGGRLSAGFISCQGGNPPRPSILASISQHKDIPLVPV